jgi:hypothetical protein
MQRDLEKMRDEEALSTFINSVPLLMLAVAKTPRCPSLKERRERKEKEEPSDRRHS